MSNSWVYMVTKWDRGEFDPVVMPKETIGDCKNYLKGSQTSRKCKQINVKLADGYCLDCWDRGFPFTKYKTRAKWYTKGK